MVASWLHMHKVPGSNPGLGGHSFFLQNTSKSDKKLVPGKQTKDVTYMYDLIQNERTLENCSYPSKNIFAS